MERILGVGLAFLLGGSAAYGGNGRACKPLKGEVSTAQTLEGCESLLGLCFTGTLKTNGWLHGTTDFVVTSAAAQPGTPLILFAGVFTLTRANGEVITLQSSGVADTSSHTYWETFSGAVGGQTIDLSSTGATDAALSTFTGGVSGLLCR